MTLFRYTLACGRITAATDGGMPMNNFRYTSYAQEIIFGPGSLEQLDQVLQRFPWRRLMLCSSKTLRRNGTITALEKVLGERLVVGYEGIQPHVLDFQMAEA